MVVGLVYGVASSLVYKKLDLRHHSEMIFMEVADTHRSPRATEYYLPALTATHRSPRASQHSLPLTACSSLRIH